MLQFGPCVATHTSLKLIKNVRIKIIKQNKKKVGIHCGQKQSTLIHYFIFDIIFNKVNVLNDS